MARNKGFMLIYPYFLFPNGFYKAYFRKFIVCLVTHVTMECSLSHNQIGFRATFDNNAKSNIPSYYNYDRNPYNLRYILR